MTSYSDEEVKEAIKGLGEFLDWAKTQHLVSENSAWKEGTKLIWAASQYLKLKTEVFIVSKDAVMCEPAKPGNIRFVDNDEVKL